MAEPREIASTRLVLIRNARDVKPEPLRLDDHDDLGLSNEGRHQATRLRDRLAATAELAGTSRLLTSNARKAIETAQVISPAVGDLPTEPDCGFCEPHSGECVGMSVDEWLSTLAQERIANWSPYAPKSPGGESYLVAIERAARAFVETILANEGETIVIVTQTVPLRASLWAFLGLPFHASYLDPEITGTGITEWVADGWLPGTGQMKARLVRYNDHGHLLPRAWSTAYGLGVKVEGG
jgi:broad specificity phosphatase PhoE